MSRLESEGTAIELSESGTIRRIEFNGTGFDVPYSSVSFADAIVESQQVSASEPGNWRFETGNASGAFGYATVSDGIALTVEPNKAGPARTENVT